MKPPNPVQSFQDFRTQQSVARQNREIQLWQQWKQAPEKEKVKYLEPLLNVYEPTFQKKVNDWSRGAAAIQPVAFKAELEKHFIGALNTYNPDKAALSTHVEMRLQKAKRHVIQHQNLAYIPEGQVAHIGKLRNAQMQLQEDLGRMPTPDELGDHLGMPAKRVNTILQSLKKDVPSSKFESDPTASHVGREREVLSLLQYSLPPDEKELFEYLYGQNGKPQIQSTNELAKRLNKSAPQISRIKTSIIKKYKSYL